MPAVGPDLRHAGFSPLALQPGWVLERYFDWQCRVQEPNLKLLSKRRGLLVSNLLLGTGGSRKRLADLVEGRHLLGPLQLTWICELDADLPQGEFEWAGRRLAPLQDSRWFGVGTFVIDLGAEEGQLLSRIASRERTKLRQAERSGLSTDATASPTREDLAQFASLYGQMARARGLERPTVELLQRMSRDGVLVLARCRASDGRTLVANLAFTSHAQGYFLYGARHADAPAGAGVLAQWALIRALKTAGLRFYDLGLVASTSDHDGRFRFKRALGGTFVPFGPEYRHVPAWLRVPYRLFLTGRQRFVRGLTAGPGKDV